MGESGLRVLDYGDGVGPDSRGLFQQRDNGAWGSYVDRMDPTTSATNFYRALLAVGGWDSLTPTLAAHKTQRNADPYHYARYWPAALEVVAVLSGTTAAPAADVECESALPADLPTEGGCDLLLDPSPARTDGGSTPSPVSASSTVARTSAPRAVPRSTPLA